MARLDDNPLCTAWLPKGVLAKLSVAVCTAAIALFAVVPPATPMAETATAPRSCQGTVIPAGPLGTLDDGDDDIASFTLYASESWFAENEGQDRVDPYAASASGWTSVAPCRFSNPSAATARPADTVVSIRHPRDPPSAGVCRL